MSLPIRVLIPSQRPNPQASSNPDHLLPPNTVPLRVRASAGFPGGSVVKNPAVQEPQETRFNLLSHEDLLEEGMASHFSILAWRTPWTEESGGL